MPINASRISLAAWPGKTTHIGQLHQGQNPSDAANLQHQCSKLASNKPPTAQGIPGFSLTGEIHHQTRHQQTAAAPGGAKPV
ncbi:hypothetical protein Nepgr_014807 [Nepenthes gracilis]|uniref:Uncharacterized protein n=1 Tax=Nepenthes gracilis TaxID=150966 RepID=A0AAD3SLV9_NEPGR|nr:hypothetical protein Nepgr_014807 [Nepenthes gracilis]